MNMKRMKREKLMKRIFAVLMMMALLLAGCGTAPAPEKSPDEEAGGETSDNAPDDGEAADNETPEGEDAQPGGGDIKIGAEFFDWTMPLGVDIKEMLDYASNAVGCEIQYVSNDWDAEQAITDVENLFSSGCQAVIVCNSTDTQLLKMVEIAEKHNGKIFQFFRTISDETVKDEIMSSPGYGGQVHEDEYTVCYTLGKKMAEEGCKNVGITNFTVGDITAEARQKGFEDAFEETGVNVVASTWDVTTGETASEVTENYLAAYPEMDGIAVAGGSGEAFYAIQNTLDRYGKTKDVLLSTVDFYDEQTQDLQEGRLGMIAGGHWCDPFFSFMLAYNYLSGAFEDSELPLEVNNNMIYLTSYEDSQLFDKWFGGEEPPFNEEEIRALSITHNPEFKFEDLYNAAKDLSLENVIERHDK